MRYPARINAEDGCAAARRLKDVHEDLQGGSFAGAIGADESVGATLGDGEADPPDGVVPTIRFHRSSV